jgi:hypothetical protein
MTVFDWLQNAGSVVFGNLLTAAFLFFIYRTWMIERSGGDPWKQPVLVFLCGCVPLLFAAWSLHMAMP